MAKKKLISKFNEGNNIKFSSYDESIQFPCGKFYPHLTANRENELTTNLM